MNNRRPPFKSRGFTLIELVIVIMLVGILALVGNEMFSKSFAISNGSNSENKSYTESQYALQRLANEIREIANPTVATGACTANQYCIYAPSNPLPAPAAIYDLAQANQNFAFYKGSALDNINISWSNNTLLLNSVTLLQNVSSLTLTFYDASLSTTAPSYANVRYVVIVMTVTPPGVPAYSLRTRVALRNAG
jgi:prepilin-type N-terminal cleavage/methylation domain-containing protein